MPLHFLQKKDILIPVIPTEFKNLEEVKQTFVDFQKTFYELFTNTKEIELSDAQIVYLEALDQSLATADSIEFNDLTLSNLTLTGQSGCGVKLSGDQTIPTGSHTTLALATELWDTQNEFNTATYKFTAIAAGKYLVIANGRITSLDDGKEFAVGIYKNGAYFGSQSNIKGGAAGSIAMSISSLMDLATNDYISIDLYHSHGSNRTAPVTDYSNNLTIIKVAQEA